jgi:hypothetical protein
MDHLIKQALLIVDVQPTFSLPMEILHGIRELSAILPSVATIERHDECVTPFEGQLGWKPGKANESLIPANRVFIKHRYLPPPAAVEYLRGLRMDRYWFAAPRRTPAFLLQASRYSMLVCIRRF